MTSPTKRTLDALRKQGYTCQVVERFCQYSKRRIDLFGCIDLVALKERQNINEYKPGWWDFIPGSILGVQATTGDNASKRVQKAIAEPRLKVWLEAGGKFQVWGWRELKNKTPKWQARIVSLVLSGGEVIAKEEI